MAVALGLVIYLHQVAILPPMDIWFDNMPRCKDAIINAVAKYDILPDCEYLITEPLDHSVDTALLRKVYDILTSESEVRKFEANFNTTFEVSKNTLFQEIDTSMHYDCSANVDVVTIDICKRIIAVSVSSLLIRYNLLQVR